MDIQLLRTFLEVYKLRHFGRAAERLYITQSAVSARVRLLEDTIGTPLFTRRRNAIEPTDAGLRLYRHAQSIVDTWQRARQETALEPRYQAVLAVGALYDLWPVLIQRGFAALRTRHADLAWRLEANISEQLTRRLLDGVLDVAFVFDAPTTGEVTVHELLSVQLVLATREPVTDACEALAAGHIAVDWGTAFAQRFARLFPDAPTPSLRVDFGALALELLRETGGSAFLPASVVEAHTRDGSLHVVESAPHIERSVYAVYREAGEREALVQRVLAALE